MGKAVLIQPSFYESMKVLPDNERLRLYDAICEYSLNGIVPEDLPPIANSFFLLMKPNIDASNKRYRASSSNGKTGGAPPGNQNARKQPKNNQTKQPKNKQDLDYELEYDLDYEKECEVKAGKPPTRHAFFPPSIAEVEQYCKENSLSIDAARFCDHYESNGWMVGKNKMKSWQAAIRNWNRKDLSNEQGRKNEESESKPVWTIGTEV